MYNKMGKLPPDMNKSTYTCPKFHDIWSKSLVVFEKKRIMCFGLVQIPTDYTNWGYPEVSFAELCLFREM